MATTTTPITFSSIADNMPVTLSGFEDKMNTLIDKGDLTSTELFELQRYVTEWSLAANTYSTILKSLGDSLRGTLQKIN